MKWKRVRVIGKERRSTKAVAGGWLWDERAVYEQQTVNSLRDSGLSREFEPCLLSQPEVLNVSRQLVIASR